MKPNLVLLLALVGSYFVMYTEALKREYELENAVFENRTDLWVWRGNASGLKALHVTNSGGTPVVQFNLCLKSAIGQRKKRVEVAVKNIRFSNDGPVDTFELAIGRERVGTFTTSNGYDWGHNWNQFYESGPIGQPLKLKPGTYPLTIAISTDMYGAELDKINLEFVNQDPNVEVFCGGAGVSSLAVK